MRVLLSDGSGLTARQVVTQLAAGGHTVEVLTPDRLALARFSRHVARVHPVPRYGSDPLGWLDAAIGVLRRGRFDVLLPTQEQVAVLSRHAARVIPTGVGMAVPPFDALVQVQDKVAQASTLARLGLPRPETVVATTVQELLATAQPPVFVKTPIGTATRGVRYVNDTTELHRAAEDLAQAGAFDMGGVVAQRPVLGSLVMIQAVYAGGRLLAAHANLRTREGANGGASGKRSVDLGVVAEHLAALGAALDWHGALALDAILTLNGPSYIDINPRLVEPGNAWRSGVDLVEVMLRVSLGDPPPPLRPGRSGTSTHQLLLAVMAAAASGRSAVLRELLAAARRTGHYRDSREELTPVAGDLRAGLPVAFVSAATLVRPAWWRWLANGSVANYALTPEGWRAILATAVDGPGSREGEGRRSSGVGKALTGDGGERPNG